MDKGRAGNNSSFFLVGRLDGNRPYRVCFVTASPYNADVIEWHRSMDDARLRACALNWSIKSVTEYK